MVRVQEWMSSGWWGSRGGCVGGGYVGVVGVQWVGR